ncbi:MAG: beta-glucosidase [Lachnospiraceae bacterium]|nr:beta-glucosidase [Lachnospiraceae bacterium]
MKRWARAFYQPSIPLGEDGTRVTASKAHIELSKNAAKEGMVLLKNDGGVLPLSAGSKIALFGKGSFDYVKGGGGSGDVTVSYVRNLYEGLKQQNDTVSMCEELCDFYCRYVAQQYETGLLPGKPEEPVVPVELLAKAKAFTDTAIIALCRFSEEGCDRKPEDFYLTAGEKLLIQTVKENFSHVIIVLNIGAAVETAWFAKEDSIEAALLIWQAGMEGGLAAAELLVGKGNPSGKLVDTFAEDLYDYPSTAAFQESDDYVEYIEDIYVGYRYFETVSGAKQKVIYPFGHGLSYTTFDIIPVEKAENESCITLKIKVINTGDYAGKEIVQVYAEAPQGKLGKPAKQLVAFAKTEELQPGEVQELDMTFAIASLASYDDTGKVQKSAYVLEVGAYRFYVGSSVRNAALTDFSYVCGKDIVVEQLSEKLVPDRLSKRMLADGTYENLTVEDAKDPNENGLERLKWEQMECMLPEVRAQKGYCFLLPENKKKMLFSDVAEGKMTLDEFLTRLTDEDLAVLLGGQPNTGVANTFGFGNLPQYDVPNIMTADGPAGLRIAPECGICTTAWPCATLLACTWNTALVEKVGAAAAMEVKENNIGVWLAPAVNIHRNPLCGRNFEYYSEDPYVTGKIGAAMVCGIQSHKIAATVKHFALNNKEVNRKDSDSIASERAIREIYLKGFEMIVKEAGPWAIMSSYNIINGVRASENRELLTDILRNEWGYRGMVTTDWWAFAEHYKETKAGNDVKMGCGYPQRLLEALEKGLLTRTEMEICGKRILDLILKIE